MKRGLGTSYNNIICCPLPSICTHILSQEATFQYNITLNVRWHSKDIYSFIIYLVRTTFFLFRRSFFLFYYLVHTTFFYFVDRFSFLLSRADDFFIS